jgi:5-methylcytosine-specific restriction enzyme subunit McrC
LIQYNEKQDSRFFTPIYGGIKFKQYVGVLQVGNITIEVLPKADKQSDEAAKDRWRNVLIEMLKVCRKLPLEASTEANLSLKQLTLMDIYIYIFLEEVERIVHQGLVKQYRRQMDNQTALRGALQFSEHIQRNLVHKERFFVRHQLYDTNHLLHQILREALQLIPMMSSNTDLSAKAQHHLLYFSTIGRLKVTAATFSNIVYHRKTEHYQKAIQLAELILLNFSPDLQHGQNSVLAILFDMNKLWEGYLYRQLKRLPELQVKREPRKKFWENRVVKPDILVEWQDKRIILDAKWKVLNNAQPSDADLKQMYVYHHYWEVERTFLVYPEVYDITEIRGTYHKPSTTEPFVCQLFFVSVLDGEGRLNWEFGRNVLGKIKRSFLNISSKNKK